MKVFVWFVEVVQLTQSLYGRTKGQGIKPYFKATAKVCETLCQRQKN